MILFNQSEYLRLSEIKDEYECNKDTSIEILSNKLKLLCGCFPNEFKIKARCEELNKNMLHYNKNILNMLFGKEGINGNVNALMFAYTKLTKEVEPYKLISIPENRIYFRNMLKDLEVKELHNCTMFKVLVGFKLGIFNVANIGYKIYKDTKTIKLKYLLYNSFSHKTGTIIIKTKYDKTDKATALEHMAKNLFLLAQKSSEFMVCNELTTQQVYDLIMKNRRDIDVENGSI